MVATGMSMRTGGDLAEALGGRTVAVALGGGGARGLAHISVLEALDAMGVRPVAMAGTSIGAIIGAAYAAGFSGAELRAHTEALLRNRLRLARRLFQSRARGRKRLFKGVGHPLLIDGERFLDAFWPAGVPERFEDLAIPLTVVATDFRRRCEMVFEKGPLRPAVAGSMSLPGVVRATKSEGHYLVDGGLVNPLPYEHLAGKADIIVAVNVSGNSGAEAETRAPTAFQTMIVATQILMSSISARMIEDNPPDVLIAPAVHQYLALDIFKASRIFEAGDSCAALLRDGLLRAAGRLEAQRRD
ncbi:patatin-like phospholipase family protein [Methylocystis echinoides]|uniref:Patatin n=1 Tax=Methylocystis echinoides TaxID=29468 RepID=A0A9W6GQI1_9HYPH|nr:patatin-like phospholipase family protein [Methylocystis echinoides]GLI91068.1 patatin [Methylocystis echinoides]